MKSRRSGKRIDKQTLGERLSERGRRMKNRVPSFRSSLFGLFDKEIKRLKLQQNIETFIRENIEYYDRSLSGGEDIYPK